MKWNIFNSGYGLIIYPSECENDLIPNLSATQNQVCKISPPNPWNDETWEIKKSEALLISAAPELMDFAEKMKSYFDENPNGYQDLNKQVTAIIEKVRGEK